MLFKFLISHESYFDYKTICKQKLKSRLIDLKDFFLFFTKENQGDMTHILYECKRSITSFVVTSPLFTTSFKSMQGARV